MTELVSNSAMSSALASKVGTGKAMKPEVPEFNKVRKVVAFVNSKHNRCSYTYFVLLHVLIQLAKLSSLCVLFNFFYCMLLT
jgi:hypothetical protein